LVTIGSGV